MKNDIERSLKIAIVLTLIFFVVEVAGAWLSGSLSLLGDAGHMLRDVIALLISLSAIKIARKLPTKTKTFGYHRVEVLAALLNGVFLVGMSGWIMLKAYQRIFQPAPIEGTTMFTVAFIGLVVNLYVVFKLHGSHDINVRSAFLHVLTDTLSSLAVIIASILIILTNRTIIDPVLGIGIALFILFSAFSIIRDALRILLEFTPKDIEIDDIVNDILSVKGVRDVHNIHLWSLCSNINVMDAHVLTNEKNMEKLETIKKEIKEKLEKYNIKHVTLEFECEMCANNERISRMNH